MDTETRELLSKEFDLTHNSIMDAWKIYMTWFTFFFTANLIVMGWIFSKTTSSASPESLRVLGMYWVFLNSLGVATVIVMGKYSWDSHKRMSKILLRLNEPGGMVEEKPAFPLLLSIGGASGNGLALIANILVWGNVWIEASEKLSKSLP